MRSYTKYKTIAISFGLWDQRATWETYEHLDLNKLCVIMAKYDTDHFVLVF